MSERVYQIQEMIGNEAGASNKARSDITNIAMKLGFDIVTVRAETVTNSVIKKIRNKISYSINLHKSLKKIPEDSILLVQVPILNLARYSHQKLNHMNENRRIISIIHDVNDLRSTDMEDHNSSFYELLRRSSCVISHNQSMTEHLMKKGVKKEKIVNLQIFDYLLECAKDKAHFSRSVTIAGNLDPTKVQYLSQIKHIQGCDFILYGPNYDNSCGAENIKYKGVVNSNELPYRLNEGFGLVWDGTSIETCAGPYGDYLRYNNPHKLSLYLASGVPVIIWSKAAEAEFVKQNGVGITVESLLDLPDILDKITEEEYVSIVNNVENIQGKIISGYYANAALSKAIEIVENSKD